MGPSVPDGYSKLGLVRKFNLVGVFLPLSNGFLDLIYYGYVGNGRTLLPVPFLALLVFEAFGDCLLVLMTCRACPSLVPRKKDLKKLFDGPSRNFWYGVEEAKYFRASALGSDVVTKKKICRETGVLNDNSIEVSSSRRYVG